MALTPQTSLKFQARNIKKFAPISQAAFRAEQADFGESRKLNHRIRELCALPASASVGQDTFLASLTFNSFFISEIFWIAPRFNCAVANLGLAGANHCSIPVGGLALFLLITQCEISNKG